MTFINFLIHIKNSYLSNKSCWYFPATYFQYRIGKILQNYGYIKNIFWINIKNKSILYIELNINKQYISNIKFFKNYYKKKYLSKNNLLNLNKITGLHLISTSKGVMSSQLAYKLNLGGKLICYIW
uniref:30S ribosomal protein S8 n=1 Tax=Nephromyces sp. ex Molgula occidentalis TaxID=2544991 RepID=A0A5C1H880_9APIC|nr:30S ribosomal protein S8 [Nephromyces sp. ex Molgula occidentalis]